MKRVFIITGFILAAIVSKAQEISYDEARIIAEEFFSNSESSIGNLQKGISIKVDTLITYYTEIPDLTKSGSFGKKPAFYIFNRYDSPGFVMVSADKRVRTIIASSMSKNLDEINPGLQVLLRQYVREIEYLVKSVPEGAKSDYGVLEYTAGDWLLSDIEWNQGCFYNEQCPEDSRGPCDHVWAGCVAVAMAQIMSYWNYPASNTAIPGYTDPLNYNDGTPITGTSYIIEDIPSTTYNWALMPDMLSEANLEVSRLIYHCGAAARMDYSPTGSSSNIVRAFSALRDYFDYSSSGSIQSRTSYSEWNDWYNLIKTELDNERPIYYRATDPDDPDDPDDPSGGHAFVLDGYKSDNSFHINWGWGGSANEFYFLTLLEPGSYSFSETHMIITGIEPENPELVPPQLTLAGYTQEIGTNINLTFNEPMAETTLNSLNIIVQGSLSGSHSFTPDYNPNTNTCIIDPDSPFSYGETVYVTLTTRVTDLAGNSLDGDKNGTPGPDYTFAFTTETIQDILSNGLVNPQSGTTNDNIKLSVLYTDQSGLSPNYIRVVIGTNTYNLSYESGQVSTGAIYSLSQSYPAGTYTFYFEAQSAGGIVDRWPDSGSMNFYVSTYAEGHDIALQDPILPQSVTPGASVNISVTVYNRGIYPESNFPVDFYIYRPDGTLCDHETINVSYIAANIGQQISTTLSTSSVTGFYTINVIAGNKLDSDRSNNTISPKVYAGSNVDSDEYEAQWCFLADGATGTFYGQTIYLWGANESEAYFSINGGSLDDYEKGRLTGVINDTYAIEYFDIYNDGVYFYFGPATSKISISPNPVTGFQGEEKSITVTSSVSGLRSGFESTFGEGYNDGALIESWMDHEQEISPYQRVFSLNLPTDNAGEFEGWIKFSVYTGTTTIYYNKVVNVNVVDDYRDFAVLITQPANGADFNEGDPINVSGTITNNSTAVEVVNYSWVLRNSQYTAINQVPGSGTIAASGSISPACVFSTAGLTEGSYIITLELINNIDDNLTNDIAQVSVDIFEPVIINADFIASVQSGNTPLTVDFSDLSSSENTTITSWAWDFNGDGITDKAVRNPSFTYSSPGRYTVSLTAGNGTVSDTEIKNEYIIVVQITADFTADNLSGYQPLTVSFTDLSTSDQNLTSWHWDFGDGQTSTDQNPVHIYNLSGTFYVSLIAGNDYGDDIMLKDNYIEVLELITVPDVETAETGTVAITSALSGGVVTDDGGSEIIVRGVCWDTSPNPASDLPTITEDGTGTGSFSSNITGLYPGTTYYVRAYATNSAGTGYGDEVVLRTYNADAIEDFDGNYYNIVTIGTQVWIAENLRTTRFNDGTVIPLITDNLTWASQYHSPAYCWYENNSSLKDEYGAMYNFYTADASVNGGRNMCPVGWHVPDVSEWTALTDYLGGASVAGGRLKEAGTDHWLDPNTGASDDYGFTALPGGYRGIDGIFRSLGNYGIWWSSDKLNDLEASNRSMSYNSASVSQLMRDQQVGFSVRCIKDSYTQQTIPLVLTEGWNILSLAVTPPDISMTTIFDPLINAGELVKIQEEAGRSLERLSSPVGWINEIGQMSPTEGYKVRVNENTALQVTGQPVALPLNIPLEPCWNIIGYPSMNPQDASTAFGSLISSGALVKVQNELGQAIEQLDGIWSYGFMNLVPGEGYKVKTTRGTTLTVTGGTKGAVLVEVREMKETEHFVPEFVGNGLDHMNIYIGMGEWEPPSPPPSQSYGGQGLRWPKEGDEIGVFDGDICVGSAVVENDGKYIQVIASFDDPETMEKDGFMEGNTLVLRLWNRETGEETELRDTEPLEGYSMAFERQGTTVLKAKLAGERMSYLGDAYPNPSRERTTFKFGLAGESRVRLEIIDVVGNTVAIVVDETMTGGIHRVEWDNTTASGNKTKKGMYLYKLTMNRLVQIKQLVIN